MKIRNIFLATAAGAMALGAIGSGVGANFVHSLTANASINTGKVGCALSSSDQTVAINGDTATLTLDAVQSSAPGNETKPVTVTNTGDMPIDVTWSEVDPNTGGPSTQGGVFGSGNITFVAPTPDLFMLAKGDSGTWQLGFQWPSGLASSDQGQSGTVSYIADCTDVPTQAQSSLSFFTNGNAKAYWSNNEVQFSVPSGGSNIATTPYSQAILANVAGTSLPQGEPQFTTPNYSAGSPRWVVFFTDGSFAVGYPVSEVGAANWAEDSVTNDLSYATLVKDFGSKTIAQVLIVSDNPGNYTISCAQYNSVNYIGSGACTW